MVNSFRQAQSFGAERGLPLFRLAFFYCANTILPWNRSQTGIIMKQLTE